MTSIERMQAKTSVGISDRCENIKKNGEIVREKLKEKWRIKDTILERNKERKNGMRKSRGKYLKEENRWK